MSLLWRTTPALPLSNWRDRAPRLVLQCGGDALGADAAGEEAAAKEGAFKRAVAVHASPTEAGDFAGRKEAW